MKCIFDIFIWAKKKKKKKNEKAHEVEASGIDKHEKSVVNERRSHSKDSRRIYFYGRVLPTARNFFRSGF